MHRAMRRTHVSTHRTDRAYLGVLVHGAAIGLAILHLAASADVCHGTNDDAIGELPIVAQSATSKET